MLEFLRSFWVILKYKENNFEIEEGVESFGKKYLAFQFYTEEMKTF